MANIIKGRLEVASLLVLTLAGCDQAKASAQSSPSIPVTAAASAPGDVGKARLFLAAVDRSDSVPQVDRTERWPAELAKELRAFLPGHAIQYFAVGENTESAPPFFEAATAATDSSLPLRKRLEAHHESKSVSVQARQAFEVALREDIQARRTDLLGAVARAVRVRSSLRSDQELAFLIFSDMLNVSNELHMERQVILPKTAPALAKKWVKARGFGNTALKGVRVRCHLTSSAPSSTWSPERRAGVESFWRSLFSELGAELEHFDNSSLSLGSKP